MNDPFPRHAIDCPNGGKAMCFAHMQRAGNGMMRSVYHGCITLPISIEAEATMMRLIEDMFASEDLGEAKEILAALMTSAIEDFGYGKEAAKHRSDIYQGAQPIEATLLRVNPQQNAAEVAANQPCPEVVNSNHVFDMMFNCGSPIEEAHAALMCMWLGWLPPKDAECLLALFLEDAGAMRDFLAKEVSTAIIGGLAASPNDQVKALADFAICAIKTVRHADERDLFVFLDQEDSDALLEVRQRGGGGGGTA
jgi:hypothetical protein